VKCWHNEYPNGFSTPTRIANIWLLSSIAVVADKLTHCPNTVSVFCHGCSTVLPRHNCIFCTFLLYFQLWPSDIIGDRYGVSSFHGLSGHSGVFFRRTVNPINGLSNDKLFSWFSLCSRFGITLYRSFLVAGQTYWA